MTLDDREFTVEVTEPGSDEDPFKGRVETEEDTTTEDETEDEEETDDDAEEEEASEETLTDEDAEKLNTALDERVDKKLRERQSGWDRQIESQRREIDKLTKDAAAERKEARERVREAQARDLTDEERQEFKDRWALEDKEAELADRETASEDFYRTTMALDLFNRHREYVSEQDLADKVEAGDSVEEMERFCLQKQADHYKAIAEGKPVKGKKPKKAPSGSKAKSDTTGSGTPRKGDTGKLEQGRDAMAEALKNKFKQPGFIK